MNLTSNTPVFSSQYLHPDVWTDESLSMVDQQLSHGPLFPHQHPNPLFAKEELQKLPAHKWMENMDFELIHPGKISLSDFLEIIEAEAKPSPDFVKAKDEGIMKLIALDTETTGLDKTVRIIGGAPSTPAVSVGICIATSGTKGYYLPVLHNKTDGIDNYSISEIVWFLQELQKYRIIYHNASYDREILETHGVKLNTEFIDAMLIGIALGLREKYFSVGLKQLSEKLLNRKMLEIKELSGQKKFIPLNYYPATTVTVYGCSDACNTFALFEYMTKDSKTNPYIHNRFPMRLDMRTNDFTRWMLRHGMPIDYNHLRNNIRTLIRRKIILTDKFEKEVTNTVPISSAEKVGIFIGETLRNAYFKFREGSEISQEELNSMVAKVLMKEFQMEVKIKALKGGSVKTTFSTGADILSSLIKIDKKDLKWLPDATKTKLKKAAVYIERYRNVTHDIGVFLSMYRYAYSDDLNMNRVSVGIKFNGTITNRYSNQSGKGSLDRFTISRGARKTTLGFVSADSTAGLNIQGVSSAPIKLGKAMKVVKAPEQFMKDKNLIDMKVEAQLRSILEEA